MDKFLKDIFDLYIGFCSGVDYYALFFVVFIALNAFSAVSFALKLLADKRVKFSFVYLLVCALFCGALFSISYTEYLNFGVKFSTISMPIAYAVGEFLAITVLYAVFYGFARKDKKLKKPTCENVVSVAETNKSASDFKVYPVATKKSGDKELEQISVDFDGVKEFLNNLKAGGVGAEKIDKLLSEISFYDGLEIKGENVKKLNQLFSEAVSAARGS